MGDGVSLIDKGVLGVADDEPGASCVRASQSFAEGVNNGSDGLTLAHIGSEFGLKVEYAAPRRSHPSALAGEQRLAGGRVNVGSCRAWRRCDRAVSARGDGNRIEPRGFAAFVQQDRGTSFGGRLPQRPVASAGVDGNRCGKGSGKLEGVRIVQVGRI